MPRVLSIAAIGLASVAIAYAMWLHRTTNERVRTAVAEAVRTREEALIREWKPVLHDMYRDMRVAGVKAEPRTLEELFAPLFRLMNRIGPPGNPSPARP
jgi:hypothetical protein